MKKIISSLLSVIMLCFSINGVAYADGSYFNDEMWKATCNYNDGLYYEALGILNALYPLDLSETEKKDCDILQSKINTALNDQPDIMLRVQKIRKYINGGQYYEATNELNWLNSSYPSLAPAENNIVWGLKVAIDVGFEKLAQDMISEIRKSIKNGQYFVAMSNCDIANRYSRSSETSQAIHALYIDAYKKSQQSYSNSNESNSSYNNSNSKGYRVGKRTVSCKRCQGDGYVTCSSCQGRGDKFDNLYPSKRSKCGRCFGSGKVECSRCHGKGLETEEYYY